MKKSIVTLGIIAATTTPMALAEDNVYQVEIIPKYGQSERDPQETDSYSLSGVFHFKTVSTEGHPLEEAAYLNRSSYVELDYQHDEVDAGTGGNDESKNNTYSFLLHLNTGERYFIDLNLTNMDMSGGDIFTAGLGFGGYITDNSSVHIQVLDEKKEADDPEVDDASGQGYSIGGRGVLDLGGEQALALEADYTILDVDNGLEDTDTISLGARYYFLRTTHVGLEYSLTSTDDEDVDGFTLEAQHFITPRIALGASFSQESSDDDDAEDTDKYNLWAKFRF